MYHFGSAPNGLKNHLVPVLQFSMGPVTHLEFPHEFWQKVFDDTLGIFGLKIQTVFPSTESVICHRNIRGDESMWIAPEDMVERQVFFNSKLEEIAKFEDPDNKYTYYLDYLTKDASANRITWANVQDYMPLVEVVIKRNLSGHYSYKIIIDSPDSLTLGDWKSIRDAADRALADFEFDKFESKRSLFYPEDMEREVLEEKSKRIVERKRLALKIRREYEVILNKIKKLLKTKATESQIAKQLGTSEKTVKEHLYAPVTRRPTPAYLAKIIILEGGKAKELGLDDDTWDAVDRLEDEVLHRSRGREFHKSKRYARRKRLIIPPSDEEVEKFLGLT